MFWPISWLISNVVWFFQVCVIAHTITTLLGVDPKNPLVRLVRVPAEPVLRLVRPLAKKIPGPFDWSPALALVGLELVKRILG